MRHEVHGRDLAGRERTGSIGFPGDCETHRGAVHIVRGEWAAGEREVEQACRDTRALDMNHTALAQDELGELRLRQGALTEAADAFREAHSWVRVPSQGWPCWPWREVMRRGRRP